MSQRFNLNDDPASLGTYQASHTAYLPSLTATPSSVNIPLRPSPRSLGLSISASGQLSFIDDKTGTNPFSTHPIFDDHQLIIGSPTNDPDFTQPQGAFFGRGMNVTERFLNVASFQVKRKYDLIPSILRSLTREFENVNLNDEIHDVYMTIDQADTISKFTGITFNLVPPAKKGWVKKAYHEGYEGDRSGQSDDDSLCVTSHRNPNNDLGEFDCLEGYEWKANSQSPENNLTLHFDTEKSKLFDESNEEPKEEMKALFGGSKEIDVDVEATIRLNGFSHLKEHPDPAHWGTITTDLHRHQLDSALTGPHRLQTSVEIPEDDPPNYDMLHPRCAAHSPSSVDTTDNQSITSSIAPPTDTRSETAPPITQPRMPSTSASSGNRRRIVVLPAGGKAEVTNGGLRRQRRK
ncbi:uncharacterized protein IL334_000310 [Kwoniella shivajii]|uniref:Uncharacterized protein n=1 Tax=Kwoniella shivajii TaxID=564305 RepID=A0ABZ1CP57_9TREE|nr:hypothetical protein IL334_000310 [Kwoniella shivajii]